MTFISLINRISLSGDLCSELAGLKGGGVFRVWEISSYLEFLRILELLASYGHFWTLRIGIVGTPCTTQWDVSKIDLVAVHS